jgi:hypothetical protein
MTRFRRASLTACLLCFAVIRPMPATAATQTLYLDTRSVNTTTPQLAGGDVLFVDTHIRDDPGSLSHSVTFSVAPGVTIVSGRATWAISTAAGPGPRLIGFNIDLFDASNALVLSDTIAHARRQCRLDLQQHCARTGNLHAARVRGLRRLP